MTCNCIWNCYSNLSFRRKTATWCSTVAGILSSGCPQFFKSGTKEFNKETGWWGLQQNIAPAVKFSEAGLEYFVHGKTLLLLNKSNVV